MAITFEDVIKSKIFKNKAVLRAIIPPSGKLVSREKQESELILELGHILKNMPASNLFLFGFPGTGKTSLMMSLCDKLKSLAMERSIDLKIVYINCSQKKTDTAIITEIYNEISNDERKLTTGVNRSWLIGKFKATLEERNYNLLIILDEIDYVLREQGDDILYLLSRLKDDLKMHSKISTTIISNHKDIPTYIETRTRSSFGNNVIFFPPYTKDELMEIMKDRVNYSFYSGVVEDGVVEKISDIEANRRGDAREAIELLENTGKIAIERGSKKILLDYVEIAEEKIEMDTVVNTISGLTLNNKLVYLSIMNAGDGDFEEVYEEYISVCKSKGVDFLTERSIRDMIGDFLNMGLIRSKKRKSNKTKRQIAIYYLGFTGKIQKAIKRFLENTLV